MNEPPELTQPLPNVPTRPTAQYVEGSGWRVIGDLPVMASDAERRLALVRAYVDRLDLVRDDGFVTVPIDALIRDLTALIDGPIVQLAS